MVENTTNNGSKTYKSGCKIANVKFQQIMAESYKQWANNGWKHKEWLMREANDHCTATNNGQTYKRWANNGHNATNNG